MNPSGRRNCAVGILIVGLVAALPFRLFGAPRRDGDDQAAAQRRTAVPLDPVYAQIAAKTGGRVVDMRDPAQRRAFEQEWAQARRQARIARWRERLRLSEGERLGLNIVIKWVAYCFWCGVGLFWNGGRRRMGRALAWGTARVALGIGVGLVLAVPFLWAASFFHVTNAGYPVVYLVIYVPTRWVEWTIMTRVMGLQARTDLWRAGGIAVSCLADAVQMALVGAVIPVGRIFC